MKPLLLDTNECLRLIRRKENPPPNSYLSIVIIGELKSFALKRGWGVVKTQLLSDLLSTLPGIDLDDAITDRYALVDAYSQGLLTDDPLPPGTTARNMGKNDLWIAATAFLYDLELQTTDHDFDHLVMLGLKLNRISV